MLTNYRDLLMRKDLLFRHMDAYYDNLYWLPCLGIFHPATTQRQIQVRGLRAIMRLCSVTDRE